MKPNNYYYKRIAKKVDSTIDCDKFKSNVYYMRRIAIKHGGSYTNHRSSNKYLHDWAVALGYTYTDHEYNIKYLYDIAKYYDASTQANQTENHYLIIIHDNIVPPTPSQKLHKIDVELTDGKNILSYADRTTGNEYATLTFTAKDEENAPIPNLELSLDVTGEQTSTITTDSNGQYEITYNTQGIGDVEISLSKEVDGIFVSKTYAICDAWRYSTTEYTSTQNVNWSLPSGNFEIDFKCRPSARSGCFPQIGIGTDTNNIIYMGQGQSDGETTFVYKCNGTNQEVLTGTHQSTLNDWNDYEYSIVNGVHTLKAIGDTLTSTKSCVTLSKLVQIYNQNSKIKDILIKPL